MVSEIMKEGDKLGKMAKMRWCSKTILIAKSKTGHRPACTGPEGKNRDEEDA